MSVYDDEVGLVKTVYQVNQTIPDHELEAGDLVVELHSGRVFHIRRRHDQRALDQVAVELLLDEGRAPEQRIFRDRTHDPEAVLLQQVLLEIERRWPGLR